MVQKTLLKDVNYYFITDEGIAIPPHEQVEKAVDAGVKMIQYRAKKSEGRVLYEEACRIKDVCEDTLFIVNDRLDIAIAVEADGVHLGQDDLPPQVARDVVGDDMIIGISTHDLEQAEKAEEIADYIGIGPVHSTDTKQETSKELGIEGALKIASKVDVPTAAIGGIEEADLKRLAEGVDMVCAISSVTREGNLSDRTHLFEEMFSKAKRGD